MGGIEREPARRPEYGRQPARPAAAARGPRATVPTREANPTVRRSSHRAKVGSVIASSQWAGLELRHLITLEAVAKHRSFRKAALRLNYTQSGISQQIAALERIVGERLIERPGGSRPVGLTEAGEIVLRHAEAVFHEITAAQADVAALSGGTAGVVRVGTFQSVSSMLVPELIRRLAQEQPDVTMELVQTPADTELLACSRRAGSTSRSRCCLRPPAPSRRPSCSPIRSS